MNETTNPDAFDDAAVEETERQHAQDPAEGLDPDDEAQQGEDVERVHPQEPAEG